MRYDSWHNLAEMFFEITARDAAKPMLWAKSGGQWRATTRGQAAAQAAALAETLAARGIKRGDRVMLIAESRPEWLIADAAIMAAGAITVPAYTTNQPDDHRHILGDSGAAAAIVSTAALAERFLPAAKESSALKFLIAIEPPKGTSGLAVPILKWDDVIALNACDPATAAARARAIARNDTACIIYTSGTGGVPKGVMLSHGAILSNCKGAYHLLLQLGLEEEVFLSFLPLSHSYEHTAGLHFPVSIAAQIYYAEGADKLAANMVEVRPTFMTAVPRLYETMHARILRGIDGQSRLKAKLFHRAVALGIQRYEAAPPLSVAERIVDAALEILVRKKVQARFGGRLKALVSGGAPLNRDIGVFFTALGLRLLQGYGLTESAPVISCNPPRRVRIETVGPPVVDVEVKIADDGEICCRGELVMQGYWGNAAATAEAIKDGWLHTGDIGVIDADGYIRITDRKKDIIVNSGGDNVSPQRIEGLLTLQPEIAQAMVYGDKRPHLVALVVPNEDWARSWAAAKGRNGGMEALARDGDFHAALGAAIERVNKGLSTIERVRRFALTPEPFTVHNGMMTPTLKIRRHKIVDAHRATLESLYGG